jgi:hypothetical protein
MLGYNSQRRGTARTSQFNSHLFPCNCYFFPCNYYVCSFLYSVYCLCVNVYCTAAIGCQPNCSLIIIIIIIKFKTHGQPNIKKWRISFRTIYRRFHKIRNSSSYVCPSALPSVSPLGTTQFVLDGFS